MIDRPFDYKITTKITCYTEDAIILAALERKGGYSQEYERLMKWEIDTLDAAVRAKLIELGWTPPIEPADLLATRNGG